MAAWNPKANEIFVNALEEASSESRAAYLDEICGGDADLRQQVDALFAAHGQAGSFLNRPIAEPAVTGPPEVFTAAYGNDKQSIGTVLAGKYKLLEPIGGGGMGTVYMAQQTQPVKRLVAVKVIKAGMDSKSVLARFDAERQALAMMDHANIARVFDAGATSEGQPFFVMELVKGVPITKFCDDRKLPPRDRLALFVQVCQAIQHAHQKGIIHRDIKPSNVLVAMYDDRAVPKVIDFGVAKATGSQLTDHTLVTNFGAVVGTPEYMSPEQASFNQMDVDTRSDVYALGVMLYELLTGATPVDRQSLGQAAVMEILRIVREVEPPRPSDRLSTSNALPSIAANRQTEPAKLTMLMRGELDWVVMKALEKDRARRYDTANALARDVQRYLADEIVEARPPSAGYRLRKFVRKHKTAFTMTSMAAALLLFGIVATSWQAIRATLAETDATTQRNAVVIAEGQARTERDDARAANVALQATQKKMRHTLYFARSNLLQNAWEANDFGQVFQLLDQQRPGPGERDLRGFEWYYRDRLCHQDLLTITGILGEQPGRMPPEFSPDGKFVVGLAKQEAGKVGPGKIAIYDLANGKERARLPLNRSGFDTVSWTHDSKRIKVFQRSGNQGKNQGLVFSGDVVICDAADSHLIYRLSQTEEFVGRKGAMSPYDEVTLSPEGKYLAISKYNRPGSMWGGISVSDVATGKIIRRLEDAKALTSKLTFSPDGPPISGYRSTQRKPSNTPIDPQGLGCSQRR